MSSLGKSLELFIICKGKYTLGANCTPILRENEITSRTQKRSLN